ncbi:hypothetical protein [Burkholderia cenocepacia]|uniref:hypothetical protein n=1 Tax=Burkholderia cenocepacia TaxID=95486 RepID=UPI000F5A1036|nr:hypothetical protein [Burkholderia cenocepacia]RQU83889.1 hypothetical protein DF040_33725 [Burkholderia cenocepacia]
MSLDAYFREGSEFALKFALAVWAVIAGTIFVKWSISKINVWVFGKPAMPKVDTDPKSDAVPTFAALPSVSDIAKAVHEQVNVAFYRALIEAVEGAIASAGFKFGNERAAEVPLPYSVLLTAADALSKARTELLQPYISPDRLRGIAESDRDDGFSLKYVTSIIDAMRACGRYVQQGPTEVDCWITADGGLRWPTAAVDEYVSSGLSESAVAANGTAQIHIRSK